MPAQPLRQQQPLGTPGRGCREQRLGRAPSCSECKRFARVSGTETHGVSAHVGPNLCTAKTSRVPASHCPPPSPGDASAAGAVPRHGAGRCLHRLSRAVQLAQAGKQRGRMQHGVGPGLQLPNACHGPSEQGASPLMLRPSLLPSRQELRRRRLLRRPSEVRRHHCPRRVHTQRQAQNARGVVPVACPNKGCRREGAAVIFLRLGPGAFCAP